MTESGERTTGGRAYRWGVAIAIVASLLIVWTTLVRDDGNGIGFLMLIMAAAVGGFSARFRPAGMARTMVGIAIMQGLLGVAIATDPSSASTPGGALKILLSSAVFMALWLVSAAFFSAAVRADLEGAPAS